MIIIIGIAGAGKSTQGQILAKLLNCTWLSVGQMLRDNVDEVLKAKMLKGELVDDHEMLGLLDKELKRLRADTNEIILDGTPRNLYQAEWLAKKIKAGEIKLTAVIHLKASKETVKKRLLGRGRPDDNEHAIQKRFLEYERSILPILHYFEEQGFKIYEVDGEGPVEADAEAIEQSLGF